MELTSDNLFGFVLRRYKQKANKKKQTQNFMFSKTIRKNYPNKEERKISNKEIIKYFHALIINNSNISNILYNSIDPLINECFNNLEFLSIANNYIRNIDFILKLPNLFYLDLFGNPLEELSALNKKNIFGYLRLSLEIFNEKKILNIYDLQCGIFDMELKDKNKTLIFSHNNHHICMINNEINYIIEKIKYEENRIKLYSKKKIKRSEISLLSYRSSSNNDINSLDVKRDTGIEKLIKNLSNNHHDKINEYDHKNTTDDIKIKNPFLLKINNFFDEYQSVIHDSLQNENQFINNIKVKGMPFLSDNEQFSSVKLEKDKIYLQHEKDKLILLFEIYKKISIFNRNKKDNKIYTGNVFNINVNNHIDKIFVKEIKDNIMNHSQIPRSSIIILISIIFYTIGIISEKMMNALINYILTKYYNYGENEQLPDFSNLGNIHYLSFYYSTYDYIYKRMIDNEKNISITQYKEILKILQMDKLILKSNYLNKKLNENKSKSNKTKFSEFKKNNIANEIRSIKELNITKEFLVLIEFLCDYIIYEKIEDILIISSYPGEYSYLIELKETIEETEFQIPSTNFLNRPSLSAIKFQKNKKERIYNKFYFQKNKIKQTNNKDYKKIVLNDFYKSRTLNNFNSGIRNNALFSSTNSNFNNNNIIINNNEDSEYNKSDDIDVDEFFYIDSMARNNNNILIGRRRRTNYNVSPYRLKYKENSCYFNDNSSDYENNANIKLPCLYKNPKPYEEFEFLKKMIFDPQFLSEHARNVIKFEKQKKKLKRNPKFNIRNKTINKTNKKINVSENKKEDLKTGRNAASSCVTNYENNNTSKNNINLESNNENCSNNNNYKMILSSASSSRFIRNKLKTPNNYKLDNKINLKTIIDNNNKSKKKTVELRDKATLVFDRKCSSIRHGYKTPFFEVPESFPGITLLKFGTTKNKKNIKKVGLTNRKSSSNKEIQDNKKKTYKQKVMSKIKKTIKDNILRNARRVAYPLYQSHS